MAEGSRDIMAEGRICCCLWWSESLRVRLIFGYDQCACFICRRISV